MGATGDYIPIQTKFGSSNQFYNIYDEDAMDSDSNTGLATQQSIKAHVLSKPIALTGEITDVSTANSRFVVSPVTGTIDKIYIANSEALATSGDAVITFELEGVLVSGGTITIAQGSASGAVDSATPTGTNTVTAGKAIEIITDGGSTNASPAHVTMYITPTA